jgi:hypothetical protein
MLAFYCEKLPIEIKKILTNLLEKLIVYWFVFKFLLNSVININEDIINIFEIIVM